MKVIRTADYKTAAKAKKKEESSFVKEGDEEETESFTRIFDANREKDKK